MLFTAPGNGGRAWSLRSTVGMRTSASAAGNGTAPTKSVIESRSSVLVYQTLRRQARFSRRPHACEVAIRCRIRPHDDPQQVRRSSHNDAKDKCRRHAILQHADVVKLRHTKASCNPRLTAALFSSGIMWSSTGIGIRNVKNPPSAEHAHQCHGKLSGKYCFATIRRMLRLLTLPRYSPKNQSCSQWCWFVIFRMGEVVQTHLSKTPHGSPRRRVTTPPIQRSECTSPVTHAA